MPDTPDQLDRERREEARLTARRDRDETVGLLELRGDLRDELVRRETSRRGEARLLSDPPLDQAHRVE